MLDICDFKIDMTIYCLFDTCDLRFGIYLEVRKVSRPINLQILQYPCFRANVDAEKPVQPDRGYTDRHLPAVHLPGNIHLEGL
jgi:hypothetical protein